nr:MAG TPA: hypothetical protein [Caudoviricetes sp.]
MTARSGWASSLRTASLRTMPRTRSALSAPGSMTRTASSPTYGDVTATGVRFRLYTTRYQRWCGKTAIFGKWIAVWRR